MTNVYGYLAISGGLLAFLAFLRWRSAKNWKVEKQAMYCDLISWQGTAKQAQSELQALKDDPPFPSDLLFARHLSGLGDRIMNEIVTLDEARLRSADPLRWLTEEAEGARVISRKKRLTGYVDTLCNANTEISRRIEHLIACHSATETLHDLMKAGLLGGSVNNPHCNSIEEVVRALKLEESPDETWRKKIDGIRKEFEPIYRARAQRSELGSAERQRAREEANLAFEKHKLPPMTPLQRFRSLASRGQRDSLE
jgi:hypothetical protein